MLCNRIKLFREYNKFDKSTVAQAIGVTPELYNRYESGAETPTIEIIEKLCMCYKVTADEFYGYTPRLTLHNTSEPNELLIPDEQVLSMSDLSADEILLLLNYRQSDKKADVLRILLDNE